ncbi:hypothetical protein F5B22DRAFT_661593 [Xylaria bambusicola]|uniref:uncharacterized protein n=1 Tax=Xylaria bambusicola TaxID=326684 RepID=UPI002008BA2E|nr:uncharacterized protein F5B22DRAFT_661593 [Xylaria bambusicola]KAI0505378.1 hypothetical protein F5B22DRAFT_661593 [Xylaria bambusicola]
MGNSDIPDTGGLQGIEIKTPLDPDWGVYSSTYNRRVPVIPRIVVLPATTEHVSQAVRWAAAYGFKVQARSGGHSYASHSSGGMDGSVVIDLRRLQNIELGQDGIVRVGGGVRLGNLDRAIWQDGRAIAHGTCPTVGIGGHFTHGGFGVTSRAWGLSMDQILRLDVVMADGQIVQASEMVNNDLFMAMRGAADSFGIAVNFYIRTQEAPKAITKWSVDLPQAMKTVDNAVETFQYIQDFVNDASKIDRNLNVVIFLGHDRFTIEGTYLGGALQFHDMVLMPLLQGCPAKDGHSASYNPVGWMMLLQQLADGQDLNVSPNHMERLIFFAKSVAVSNPGLSRDELKTYFEYLLSEGQSTSIGYFVGVQLYGGIDSQITANTMRDAYGHRDAMWMFQHYGFVNEGTFPEEGIRFIDNLNKALGSKHGASNNYADPSMERDEAHKLYYGAKLEILTKLKGALDPQDVFSHPQSIQKE